MEVFMNISTFNNSEFGEIRTIQKNGEVLFCGKDIAVALGYGDNFLGSDCLPVDCDNDHSENPDDWVTPADVRAAFPGITFAVHYSRFNMREKNSKPARHKGHTPRSLRNLANIMASHESLLASALNLDRSRMSRYCRTVSKDFLVELNRKKPKTMAALADTWYGSQNADYGRLAHYNESRYHMLNLHATFTKGTIEFRLFQFDAPANGKQNGLHAGQLKSYIQLCLALSQLAKQVKTASANPQQTENPKYAMRTWLLRLGFIGDEFKTARELYTKRLEGDTAFRNGRP